MTSISGVKMVLRSWLLLDSKHASDYLSLLATAVTVDVMAKRGLACVPAYSLENRMRCVASREKGVNDSRKMPADGF